MEVTLDSLFDYAEKQIEKNKKKPLPKPSEWISNHGIDPITNDKVDLQEFQGRIVDKALETDSEGYSKYDLVIWSQIKKSGKTTTAGLVGAYAAENIEAPNEICTVANDQEQAAGRIFANMMPTLEKLGWRVPPNLKSILGNPIVYGPNKTNIKAITGNYEKEAGGNQGLSLWSELWAYKGERLTRLWEEMTPPPTRRFAMRWIETYAGFINESILLQELYLKVFTDFKETDIRPGVVKVWDDLPVYEVDGHMLVFWDHEPRMPWQTQQYYLKQKDTTRLSNYLRLHENRWVEGEELFITLDDWNHSTKIEVPLKPCIFALDGSKNGASTSLVGSYREGKDVYTPQVYIWDAPENGEIDYREVEEKVYELFHKHILRPPLWYDPYECVKLAQDLRRRGVPCQEFSQQGDRVRSDTFLDHLYRNKCIYNVNNSGLRTHLLSCSVEDKGDKKIRLVAPSTKQGNTQIFKKIDAAVAQSMSAYKAYLKRGGGWGGSSKQTITTKSKNEVEDLISLINVNMGIK